MSHIEHTPPRTGEYAQDQLPRRWFPAGPGPGPRAGYCRPCPRGLSNPLPIPRMSFPTAEDRRRIALLEAIEAREDELVDLARALVRIPTVNPPGGGLPVCRSQATLAPAVSIS